MDDDTFKTRYFRYIRTLDGRLVAIDFVRQNGRRVPRFDSSSLTPPLHDQEEDSEEMKELKAEVTYALTQIETLTFLRLLDDWPVTEVAKEDRVSRTAIYKRIENMIRKNDYVWIWWRGRNKIN
jgi:DNA-directed RNA polymerase specialized sigma24 family protein